MFRSQKYNEVASLSSILFISCLIIGGHCHYRPPQPKYWGDASPHPIGIDAPGQGYRSAVTIAELFSHWANDNRNLPIRERFDRHGHVKIYTCTLINVLYVIATCPIVTS